MKEYELLRKYDMPDKPIESPFDLVSQALYTKSVNMLNIKLCKEEITEVFEYIELKQKFDELQAKSGQKVIITIRNFHFEGFEFETLSEVEKALKNKAFL